MPVLTGPLLAASALLVVAGLGKAAAPDSLARALRGAGIGVRAPLVRLVALLEVGLGAAALMLGTWWAAAAVALSYAVFTGFVLLARARGGVLATCGCFGKADTPATGLHALLTGALAVAAAVSIADPPGSLTGVAQENAATLPASAALAVCLYAALALMPMVHRAAYARPAAVGLR